MLLEELWEARYPVAIRSWYENWENLSTFFKFDNEIRKVIYTTNTVEGFHRQIRKVTKAKGAFSSDKAVMKIIYLASQRITERWTMPLHNWRLALSQLFILFEDRIKLFLK